MLFVCLCMCMTHAFLASLSPPFFILCSSLFSWVVHPWVPTPYSLCFLETVLLHCDSVRRRFVLTFWVFRFALLSPQMTDNELSTCHNLFKKSFHPSNVSRLHWQWMPPIVWLLHSACLHWELRFMLLKSVHTFACPNNRIHQKCS